MKIERDENGRISGLHISDAEVVGIIFILLAIGSVIRSALVG